MVPGIRLCVCLSIVTVLWRMLLSSHLSFYGLYGLVLWRFSDSILTAESAM